MFIRISFILLIFHLIIPDGDGATIKKSIGKSTLGSPKLTKHGNLYSKTSKPKPPPALIAIEIIDDPSHNSNSSKGNSKRTIDGSLGYGYGNSVPTRKFVIYKYSQQDIPPLPYNNYHQSNYYTSDSHSPNSYNHHHQSTSVDVVPSRLIYQQDEQPESPYYHQSQSGYYPNRPPHGAVPVILLRVYSNQLTNPNTVLHTNLPQAHPYASLNNVNLHSLLQNYVQNYLHEPHHQQAVPQYQVPASPSYHEQVQHQHPYQHQQQHAHQGHQQPDHEHYPDLPTYENYPSHQHTRVVFHSNNGHIPQNTLAYSKVTIPTYKAPEPTYPENEPDQLDGQFTYPTEQQGDHQQYTYDYPNQNYYQQGENNYQAEQEYQQGDYQQVNEPDHQSEQQYEQPNNQQYQEPSEQSYQQQTSSEQETNIHQESPLRESEHEKGPYNYHAHSERSSKQKRSKKSKIDDVPTKATREDDKTT